MATYNGAEYIREQLTSVLSELDYNDELIISDDSSDDDTVAIIQAINDSRIKLITGFNGRSPVSNFENALKQVKGKYIFLCDQDDIWLPGKVAHCIEMLKEYDIVVTDCNVVNEHLELIQESFFKSMKSGPGFLKNFFKNTYLGCCMAFRADIIPIILPFPKNIPMHDIWIGFVGELMLSTAFTDKTLLKYRRHKQNVTTTSERSSAQFFKQIGFRLGLISNIPNLVARYIRKRGKQIEVNDKNL
jgi:glycosyltransferase involved in cell wall biosynthesis